MLDFQICSLKNVSQDEAASTYFNYLTYLDSTYSSDDRSDILAGNDTEANKFIEMFDAAPADLLALSVAFRRFQADHPGRIITLWYLACCGKQIARAQLTSALHGMLSVSRNAGPIALENVRAALDSWGDIATGGDTVMQGFRQHLRVAPKPASEGFVVVTNVGDAASKEGQEMAKRYSTIINQAVPYAKPDLKVAEIYNNLMDEFPWASNVIEVVCGQIAIIQNAGGNAYTIPPLLIAGPPGCGKTKFLSTLYKMLLIPSSIIPCGGASDSGGLLAVARGWSTSRPNGCFQAIAKHQIANPAVILDEIDKAAPPEEASRNGSLSGALLSMINGGEKYFDSCLMADIDLSAVNFGATANSTKTITLPLLDRFVVVEMAMPTVKHFPGLYLGIQKAEAARLNVPISSLPQLDAWHISTLEDTMISHDFSIRKLVKTYRSILGQVALSEFVSSKDMLADHMPTGMTFLK
jgi:hypothetical protein